MWLRKKLIAGLLLIPLLSGGCSDGFQEGFSDGVSGALSAMIQVPIQFYLDRIFTGT